MQGEKYSLLTSLLVHTVTVYFPLSLAFLLIFGNLPNVSTAEVIVVVELTTHQHLTTLSAGALTALSDSHLL